MVRIEEGPRRIYVGDALKQSQVCNLNKSENGKRQKQCVYESQFTSLDIDYINYIKETVPKTTWNKDYLSELWSRKGEFLKNLREKNGTYNFDDIVTGAANAYSSLYQEIIEGYDSGTQKVYVYDKESGERRLLSKDEELKKLNMGFEELIKWDQMVAKSRMETEKALKKARNIELDKDYSVRDVTDYIQKSYLKYRQLYLSENGKNNGNFNITSLISSALNDNPNMHMYCLSLFNFAKMNYAV